MKRLTAFLITAFLLTVGQVTVGQVMVGQALAEISVLNSHVVVDDRVIRLGDLFENTGSKARVVVAPAPALGRKAVYDAKWLRAVAQTNKLNWKPASVYDYVKVERASIIFTTSEIESLLIEALSEKVESSQIEIELENRNLRMFAPTSFNGSPHVGDLRVNERSGRFSASLTLPGNTGPNAAIKAAGRIFKVVRIPVLSHQVKPGEVISADDIKWIKKRVDILQHNNLTDPDQIVGMAPRRWLRPGNTLRADELQRPVVIKKGSLVVMTLTVPNLMITSQGRALDDAIMGATIRVRNVKSKRVVDAVVIGPGDVKISSIHNHVSAAQQAAIR